MSQSRVRKAPSGSEASKTRASVVKASGDIAPSARPKEHHQRSTSKNKLPKTIRYELENALVGLCDVWFEDIKPHLVRNNIKLHVDRNGEGPAGDHSCLPAGAPDCSHDDPGAASDLALHQYVNFAACCSTRRTASAALCRRPQARLPLSDPPPRPRLSHPPLTQDSTCQNKSSLSQSSPCWTSDQVPCWDRKISLLCRRHRILTPAVSRRGKMKSLDPLTSCKVPHVGQHFEITADVSHPPSKTRNESTQTELLARVQYTTPVVLSNPNCRRVVPKHCNLTFTAPLSSPKTTFRQNHALPMRKPLAQQPNPTVPEKRYVPPQHTASKTRVTSLKPVAIATSSEDKCRYLSVLPKYRQNWPLFLENKLAFSQKLSENKCSSSHPDKVVVSLNGPKYLRNKATSPLRATVLSSNVSTFSPNRLRSPIVKSLSPQIKPVRSRLIPSLLKPTYPQNRLISSQRQTVFSPNTPNLQLTRSISPENRPVVRTVTKFLQKRATSSKTRTPSEMGLDYPIQNMLRPSLVGKEHTSRIAMPDPPQKTVSRIPRFISPLSVPERSLFRQTSPPITSGYGKCPAKTSLLRPKDTNDERASRSHKKIVRDKGNGRYNPEAQMPALFDNELINIIADENDRRLKVMYLSPERRGSISSTLMNLHLPKEKNQNEIKYTKKNQPWR